jgi:hypothetical protein
VGEEVDSHNEQTTREHLERLVNDPKACPILPSMVSSTAIGNLKKRSTSGQLPITFGNSSG